MAIAERSPLQPSPVRSVTPPRAKSPTRRGVRPPQHLLTVASDSHVDSSSSSRASLQGGQTTLSGLPGGSEDYQTEVTSLGRRVEKRKLEGGDSVLPPIKLKLSLRPAADTSADSQYKVVYLSYGDVVAHLVR